MNDSREQLGPTVHEAAILRMRRIKAQLSSLQRELEETIILARKSQNSTMLESERIATAAEPFQIVRLTEKLD